MQKHERKEAVINAARRFLEAKTDEIVSLRELSDAAGQDVSVDRWIIQAALKLANADYGAVFATVRGEGYRRLARADGTLFASGRGIYRIRRASRAALKTANNAARHANDMTADQRRRHHQQMASLGLIEHLTMARTISVMPEERPKERLDSLAGLREVLGV